LLDTTFVVKSRAEVTRENEIRKVLENEFPTRIPEADTVMLEMVDASDRSKREFPSVLAIEYSLRPRRIGYIREGLDDASLHSMITLLRPRYLIAKAESKILDSVEVPLSQMDFPWPEELSGYRLFHINPEATESLSVKDFRLN